MIYKFTEKRRGQVATKYFYKPKGYRKYISFTGSEKTSYGTPEHNVILPDGAVPLTRISKPMEARIKFLDTCFSS